MAVKLGNIENLLIRKKSKIDQILNEYSSLLHKLSTPKNQSWYFKKGFDSHLERLSNLEREFEVIRIRFNNSTLDSLIHQLNTNSVYISKYKKKKMVSFIQRIHYKSVMNQNEFIKEMISLKREIENLKPMDYYVDKFGGYLNF